MLKRLIRAVGAPLRMVMRHSRRSFARDMIAIGADAHGFGASCTFWQGGSRGKVGVVTMERGRVEILVDDDGYLAEWFGTTQHPVGHDQVRTTDNDTLRATVKKWTARWYVHEPRPSAGPHHMSI